MPAPQTERLRGIKTLQQLLAYLRDELDWPIESNDTENVTFDYEASELGLDEKSAVRIKEIKQLRPLSGNQPWGIFFVNFEKKALPVMVMRRILRSLVFKKRITAGKSERQAWHASDLLFVSAYGEEDDRAITFAHFVEDEDLGGLAELRVLGWDDDDTPLHYGYVVEQLREKLKWRHEYERRPDEWRNQWRSAFELRHREVITTSKQLALSLAELAKKIRARVRAVLRYEDGFGQVRKLEAAFRAALIHDLSEDDFADMYAQTITYGLFSAAVSRPAGIHGDNIVDMVPVTNPFLRDMLKTFLHLNGRKGRIDFDELGIQEVTSLLNSPNTHLDAVLRDFDNRNPQEDPVIHFYELFLSAYDKKKKVQRGVFYTPKPVVSYIVRSVHELLQLEFKLEHGLADPTTWGEMVKRHPGLSFPTTFDDKNKEHRISANEPFVQILDPATGTATFLVEVIDVIHRHLDAQWKKAGFKAVPTLPSTSFPRQPTDFSQYWNQYVALSLLPRLHGYELMMAPYAIAHMKIGLKLWETGYRFGTEERARIYLTNALEPWVKQLPLIGFDALAHEAAAVNEVKRHKRFTVVIGNPPYSNFGQLNRIPFILGLLDDYKRGLNEKKINLDDDFIKFVRFCQHSLDQTGAGVFGMITNNAFFDGPTHRRMRESLLTSFGTVRAINLHGSLKKGETTPDGGKDENVFDITVGVGISIYAKAARRGGASASDLYGSRVSKYERLTSRTPLESALLSLTAPEFYFVSKDFSSAEEYRSGPSIPEIFLSGISGIKTHRDELLIDYSRVRLVERFQEIARNSSLKTLKEQFGIKDTAYWTLAEAKRHIREDSVKSKVRRYFYRPFDYRHIFYEPDIIERGDARWSVMQHMLYPNLALICTRQTNPGDFTEILMSNALVDKRALASFAGEARGYPLHIYEEVLSFDIGKRDVGSASSKTSRPNFSACFLKSLAVRLQLSQEPPNGLPAGLTPEDIFHYAYAVFHSPGYRSRFAEFLKVDFPRLPLTGNLELFRALGRIGGELVALHLLESPKLDKLRTEFIGKGKNEVAKGYPDYVEKTVWINDNQGFKGVQENVWHFHIGGYQVCEKWLKDRRGRTLSKDDIAHYHKIVIALSETIRLMTEIDKVIEKHGGWPAAFEAKSTKPVTMVQFPTLSKFDRIPLKDGRNYWLEFVVACFQLVPDDLTLPLLWEAHLIALEASKYKTEFASVIGADTDEWLESLKTDAVKAGIFREVLETLAGNGNIKRIEEKGRVHLVAGVTIPVIPGDWRLYDAATILATLNARPDVVDLEQLRTSSETGYTELESILA